MQSIIWKWLKEWNVHLKCVHYCFFVLQWHAQIGLKQKKSGRKYNSDILKSKHWRSQLEMIRSVLMIHVEPETCQSLLCSINLVLIKLGRRLLKPSPRLYSTGVDLFQFVTVYTVQPKFRKRPYSSWGDGYLLMCQLQCINRSTGHYCYRNNVVLQLPYFRNSYIFLTGYESITINKG